jgi:DNA replication protein DnaC
MDDDLEQLLRGLKLQRLLQIMDQELAWAEEHGPSYTDFLKRLLRQEYSAQQDRYLEYRVRRARLPERWSLHTYPWDCQPGADREMGYLTLRPEQSNIFFKLMEERYAAGRSTLITTNLDYEEWYGFLGHKEMVGALLDRLRHRCITIRINGSSLRTPQG